MQKIDHEYRVHKFGGSSLANTERFIALKLLLNGKNEIIVVSAVQGTTTTLQAIVDAAKEGAPFLQTLENLEKKHFNLINTLLSGNKSVDIITLIQKDFTEIKDILHSVQLMGSCSKEIQDFVLGYGEIWSAKILSYYLSEYSNVIYLDASTVLSIYEKNGMKCIDWQKSQTALDSFLENKAFDQIVITGFIASTLNNLRKHKTVLFLILCSTLSISLHFTSLDGLG